jgi:hypothetical protein
MRVAFATRDLAPAAALPDPGVAALTGGTLVVASLSWLREALARAGEPTAAPAAGGARP